MNDHVIHKSTSLWQLGPLCLCLLLLTACGSSPVKTSEKHIVNKQWIKAVLEYRTAVDRDPSNVEFRSLLEQTELAAAEYYYQQGLEHQNKGELEQAEQAYDKSLLAKKDHAKSRQAMRQLAAIKESQHAVREAIHLSQAGKTQDAIKLLKRAVNIDANNTQAKSLLSSLEQEAKERRQSEGLPFNQDETIILNFRGTQTRAAFEFLGKTNQINIIFDDDVKSGTLTLFAKDVTFEQALNLMLKTTQTFYKKVSAKTLIIIPDSVEKRRQYEDYVIRTFYLNAVRAKQMVEVIKGLIKVNSIIVNENLNTIVVRDTEEVVDLINKVVEANDRKPAEMILEVEILEVNRSKAERLGIDFGGYQISSSIPSSEIITMQSDIGRVYGSVATLTLPALTFRFYKQDVDAKILANPKIRVINGKTAKIHIGDRVPLRASTITDATGQVRTTFDYKEIGIKLVAEPQINLDNSVESKISLEVSTLGENIGTAEEAAFRIGTRNAETVMLLRDGETAILGGLIRDDERSTHLRIPGLGDVPILGSVFSNYDKSGGRTDVLLTITPRVVRGWELPDPSLRQFYSGSAETYMTRSLYAQEQVEEPSVTSQSGRQTTRTGRDKTQNPAKSNTTKPTLPSIAFKQAVYELKPDQEQTLVLTGEQLVQLTALKGRLTYDASLLEILDTQAGAGRIKLNTNEPGNIQIEATPGAATNELITLRVKAKKVGIGYLVFRMEPALNKQGQAVNVQLKPSRIIVR